MGGLEIAIRGYGGGCSGAPVEIGRFLRGKSGDFDRKNGVFEGKNGVFDRKFKKSVSFEVKK
jgi:hypothetical protein